MDPQAPYHVSTPSTAPTKAAICGLPIEYTLCHDEPVIFNASGNELHDRVQLTISVKQLWYVMEALHHLRSAGVSGGVDDPDPQAVIHELYRQLVAFWVAFRDGDPSHAGAHARALRLSNRDVFHSPDQAGK